MDRRILAQELHRWAVEEMGLPRQKAPNEEVLQRLFIGQCADIWKYIIRHVRSQRTVKNIEGNLLWYQQLQRCEALRSMEEEEMHRRNKLSQEILNLRSELDDLQEQIRSAEKELISQELNIQKSQEYRLQYVMLQSFKLKKVREWEFLRKSNGEFLNCCIQLDNVTRASQSQIQFPELEPTSDMPTIPEPAVLKDIREACKLRYVSLRTVYNDAVSIPRTDSMEFLILTHRQWLGACEKVWSTHPPYHILSALQHLTIETTQDLQQQQTLVANDLVKQSHMTDPTSDHHKAGGNLEASRHVRMQRLIAQYDSMDDIPSYKTLIQEGWAESAKLATEVQSVNNKSQEASARLADMVKEVYKSMSDDGESSSLIRSAFETELRLLTLRGQRDTLLQQCRELQAEARDTKQDLNLLKQKRKDLQDMCVVMKKKQEQIQILIAGANSSKMRIRHDTSEMQKFILEKLNPLPREILLETQRLENYVMKDANHFYNLYLPALQRVSTDGTHLIPAHKLSINRQTNPNFPYYPIYKEIYASVGLPLCQAPETLLPHVADLKKQLIFLNSQLYSRKRAMIKIQEQLHNNENPNTDTLLQLLSAHYKNQTDFLVPKLEHLIDQCQQSQKHGDNVKELVLDWWEQPAQNCLPWEEREGQTMLQWQDRWAVAVTALRRGVGKKT